MKRAFKALIVGGAFVCIVGLLGRLKFATPVPFVLLSPGIFAGALVPGSGFNIEGDLHPWSALSVCVVIGVDAAIYGGIAYLSFLLIHRRRQTSPPSSVELR
jgi:hypothetical protein